MARRTSLLPLAGLICALLVGCADDSEPATSTADVATTTSAAAPDVEQFLMQADEIPGLVPIGSPVTDSGPPFDLPPDGTERLEGSGYISTTYQHNEGGRSAGVSSVVLFETEAAARDWMDYETSDEAILHQIPTTKIKRFQVAVLPGARGWTGPDLHGNAIGNLYWTQGRCMLLIAIEVEGPREGPLSAGARAIYERTGGTCPD